MTAPWFQRPVVGLDTETSGADPHDPATEIVQVALIVAMPDGTITESSWCELVRPEGDIPPGATAVHGITTEHAKDHGADPADIARRLTEGLFATAAKGLPVVAYNASFDLTLVRRLILTHGGDLPDDLYVIDPLVCDRHIDTYRKGSRKLVDTCRHYGVELPAEHAHDAEADAVASCKLAYAMAGRDRDLQADLPLLHRRQQLWHDAWAAGFADYRLAKDPACTDVPMVPWPFPDRSVMAHGAAA